MTFCCPPSFCDFSFWTWWLWSNRRWSWLVHAGPITGDQQGMHQWPCSDKVRGHRMKQDETGGSRVSVGFRICVVSKFFQKVTVDKTSTVSHSPWRVAGKLDTHPRAFPFLPHAPTLKISPRLERYIARCRADTELYGRSFMDECEIEDWLEFSLQAPTTGMEAFKKLFDKMEFYGWHCFLKCYV